MQQQQTQTQKHSIKNRSTAPPTETPTMPPIPPSGSVDSVEVVVIEVVVVERGVGDLYVGKEESGVEMVTQKDSFIDSQCYGLCH